MTAVLGIDTADQTVGVAVAVDGRVRSCVLEASGFRTSERLFTLIDSALEGAEVRKSDLDGVAVDRGPGSFTGVRVGIATAKGIASALGIPVVGVSSLGAMARGAMPFPGLVAPVLDARKRQVYGAAYDGRSGEIVVREGASDADALARTLRRRDEPCLLIGSGLRLYAGVFGEILAERCIAAPHARWPIPPSQVALLGHDELEQGRGVDPALLVPVYHRASEAQEARGQETARSRAVGTSE